MTLFPIFHFIYWTRVYHLLAHHLWNVNPQLSTSLALHDTGGGGGKYFKHTQAMHPADNKPNPLTQPKSFRSVRCWRLELHPENIDGWPLLKLYCRVYVYCYACNFRPIARGCEVQNRPVNLLDIPCIVIGFPVPCWTVVPWCNRVQREGRGPENWLGGLFIRQMRGQWQTNCQSNIFFNKTILQISFINQ